MFDVDVETRTPAEQTARDDGLYRRQVDYLFARSPFYKRKLRVAGFNGPADVGGIDRIATLPFTVKDELRQTQAEVPPFGDYLAADPITLLRVYSTSARALPAPPDWHKSAPRSARAPNPIAPPARRGRSH
jgi:phenylacetate-CoA ligase